MPSCNPAIPSSDYLTVGAPDVNGKPANFMGAVNLKVLGESPIDPDNGDQADVEIAVSLTDVRKASDLTDYTGELSAVLSLRTTDRHNGISLEDPATAVDTLAAVDGALHARPAERREAPATSRRPPMP